MVIKYTKVTRIYMNFEKLILIFVHILQKQRLRWKGIGCTDVITHHLRTQRMGMWAWKKTLHTVWLLGSVNLVSWWVVKIIANLIWIYYSCNVNYASWILVLGSSSFLFCSTTTFDGRDGKYKRGLEIHSSSSNPQSLRVDTLIYVKLWGIYYIILRIDFKNKYGRGYYVCLPSYLWSGQELPKAPTAIRWEWLNIHWTL